MHATGCLVGVGKLSVGPDPKGAVSSILNAVLGEQQRLLSLFAIANVAKMPDPAAIFPGR